MAVARDGTALEQLRLRYPDAQVRTVVGSVADDSSAAELVTELRKLNRPFLGVIAALGTGRERGRLIDQPSSRLRDSFNEAVVPHLVAKNPPRADVVAVAEAPGDAQDLRILRQPRVFQKAVEVHAFGLRAGRFERESRLAVAVGAGRSEDQDARRHGNFRFRISDFGFRISDSVTMDVSI